MIVFFFSHADGRYVEIVARSLPGTLIYGSGVN